MERKNYLVEGLSKEEKAYLKSIIVNVRKRYHTLWRSYGWRRGL